MRTQYGAYGVTVNTGVCGTLDSSSILDRPPSGIWYTLLMHTTLEIGGGITPFFIRYDIPVAPHMRYICIDVSEKNLASSKKALEKHVQSGLPVPHETEFHVRDAVTLPVADASIDAVVLSNVLTAPIHNNWDRTGTKVVMTNQAGERSERMINRVLHDDPFYAERKPLIDEALRVLKPGGSLFIYTDLIIYGIHSYERLLKELSQYPSVVAFQHSDEQTRINALNQEKLKDDAFCCCFRAEVLPESEVYEFVKK